jgi:hypothetical protein
LTQAELAKLIGVSPGRVVQLKSRGMPVDSVEGAMASRAQNVDPGRAVRAVARLWRARSNGNGVNGGDADPVGEATRLGYLAASNPAYVPAFRAALALVANWEEVVRVPVEAWDRLTR